MVHIFLLLIFSVQGAHDVEASWMEVKTQSGFAVTYLLYDGFRCVYSGQGLGCHLTDLCPNTPHCFKLRAHTEGDDSPLSEGVTVTTHESGIQAGICCNFLLLASCSPHANQVLYNWYCLQAFNFHYF